MKKMYITESLCCTAEINTTLQLYYNKIKKKKKMEAKLAELGKVERDTNLYFAASKMLVGPSFGRVERPTKSQLTILGEAAGKCTMVHGKQRPCPAAPTGEAGQISGSYQERGEGARRTAGMSSTWSAFTGNQCPEEPPLLQVS